MTTNIALCDVTVALSVITGIASRDVIVTLSVTIDMIFYHVKIALSVGGYSANTTEEDKQSA